jgi:hypothetical protein
VPYWMILVAVSSVRHLIVAVSYVIPVTVADTLVAARPVITMVLILDSMSLETMDRTYSFGTFCDLTKIMVLAS